MARESGLDLLREKPLSFAELAREEGVSPATIGRWARRGARGVVLESYLRGGRRFSSREALHRFYAAASDNGCQQPETSRSRSDAVERAERELQDMGF
jgi:hypothetical protein